MPQEFPQIERNWNFGPEFPSRVLTCMIREENFLAENWDLIKPIYFGEDSLVILAKIVIDHASTHNAVPDKDTLEALIYEKGQAIDRDGALGKVLSILNWLSILYAKDVGSVPALQDHLRHFARRREVLIAMMGAISVLEQDRPEHGDRTIEKIQDLMNTAFQVGTSRDSGVFFNDIAHLIPNMLADIEKQGDKIPTGVSGIDDPLGGGLDVGELGVVLAPPNKGKTTVLSNFAYNGASYLELQSFTAGIKKTVIFVTCESPTKKIAFKLAGIASNIPISSILMQRDKYSALIVDKVKTLGPINIKFWSPGVATVDDIKWYISNLKMIHKVTPGALYLDYADMLRGGEDNRFLGMGEIYKQLIALGNQFGMPVWTASQVRRADAEDKTIRSTGAAESWKKVELADVIVSLNQTEEEYEKYLIRMHNAKVRYGKAHATYYMKLNPETAKLSELTQEDKANMMKLPENTPAKDREDLAGAEIDVDALQKRLLAMRTLTPPPPPETNGSQTVTK